MLKHLTRLIAGLLSAGLLLALAPSASAASTYDITQVGKVTSAELTCGGSRINGTDFDGTAITDGVNVRGECLLGVHATIDMERLTAGDVVVIPVSMKGHNTFSSIKWARTVEVDGDVVADVLEAQNGTLRLTDKAKSFASISFTLYANVLVGTAVTHPEIDGTDSTLTVGTLKRTLIGNGATLSQYRGNNPVVDLKGNDGSVSGHVSLGLGDEFNGWLDGRADADMTKDNGLSYTITPLDVGIRTVDFRKVVSTCIGVAMPDGRHVSGMTAEFDSSTVTFVKPTDAAFADPTTALKPGEATYRENGDGTWSYAINLGPFLDNAFATYPQSAGHPDQSTQSLLSKARDANTMAQLVLTRFTVYPQDTEGEHAFRLDSSFYGPYVGGRTLTNTVSTRPLPHDAGSGVKAYDLTYTDTMSDATSAIRYADGIQAIVAANKWSHEALSFTGWNTRPDGMGDAYKPGDRLTIANDATLYAQWERVPETTMPETGGTMSHRRLTTMLGGGLVLMALPLAIMRRRKRD